jgi:regulator of protease activity HflC (stomatin/prohibitin superfamily)
LRSSPRKRSFPVTFIIGPKGNENEDYFDSLKKKEKDFCIEILDVGIKDIILPGEIRDIMNTVLVAEKIAQANVISRREEVASTRSLLNTAKLMEDNKTLYKLKELEYLERICDKVGEISVTGNGGLIEQLGKLMETA